LVQVGAARPEGRSQSHVGLPRQPKKGGYFASGGLKESSPQLFSLPKEEVKMTSKDKIARRKLGLLELVKEMHKFSRTCRTLGYSRQQFYEIRRNFQTFGL
jgi:hypothetical protein